MSSSEGSEGSNAAILKRLSKNLEIYDENKYYDNYIRKAYNNDNVLIKDGVELADVIIAFQLEKKELYKKLKSEASMKNDYDMINELVSQNRPYKIFNVKYELNNYDYGCDKYNELYLQQMEETYKYYTKTGEYKIASTKTGGRDLKKYNLTYTDLIDNDTYTTIKKVVNKIKLLEKTL